MLRKNCKLPVLLLVFALLLTAGCSRGERTAPSNKAPMSQQDQALPPQSNPQEKPLDDPAPPARPEALYLPVLEVLCAKVPSSAYAKENNRAELSDFDGDGVCELMATYLSIDEREQRVEIWTIRDGAPALLWEQTLFMNAGGPYGGICRVKSGGEPYICIYESNINGSSGENEKRMERYDGTIRFFFAQSRMGENTSFPGSLVQAHRLNYAFSGPNDRTPSDQNEPPEFLFDGVATTVDVFNEWITIFDQASEPYVQVGRGEYVGKSFEDILAELKN